MSIRKNLRAFIIISILGTLLHFTYDFFGQNPIIGIFSAVNESVWEHQKLLYFAIIFYSIPEYLLSDRRIHNYAVATAIGITVAILSIITLFYTYTGIIGFDITFIDIALYYIGVLIFLFVRGIIIKNRFLESGTANRIAIVYIIILSILFAIFTFFPPKIPLFIPKPV